MATKINKSVKKSTSLPKFKSVLNSDGVQIKAQRSEIVFEEFEAAQRKVVDRLAEELRSLRSKLLGLTDIYPDSSLSLLVTKSDINAQQWTNDIQNTKVSIVLKERELEIAKETYNEWFS